MKAVADTSAWYAFVLKPDRFHEKAEEFIKIKPSLLFPYPVLEELAALIHHREGKKITINDIEKIRNHPLFQVVYLTISEEKEVWDIYKTTESKIDYIDASVVWLAKKAALPIFTFDTHFKKLGLKIVP